MEEEKTHKNIITCRKHQLEEEEDEEEEHQEQPQPQTTDQPHNKSNHKQPNKTQQGLTNEPLILLRAARVREMTSCSQISMLEALGENLHGARDGLDVVFGLKRSIALRLGQSSKVFPFLWGFCFGKWASSLVKRREFYLFFWSCIFYNRLIHFDP